MEFLFCYKRTWHRLAETSSDGLCESFIDHRQYAEHALTHDLALHVAKFKAERLLKDDVSANDNNNNKLTFTM